MWPPAHGHQVDLPPELGLDQGTRNHLRITDRVLGHEPEAQTGFDHRENPVVALASINHLPFDPLAEELAGVTVEFAVHPVETVSAVEILWTDRIVIGQRMRRWQHDHHLLPEQRHEVQVFIFGAVRQAIDRDLQLAFGQPTIELAGAGIDNRELDTRMTDRNRTDKLDELSGRNRAHDADTKRGLLQAGEIARDVFGSVRLVINALQVRQHDAT